MRQYVTIPINLCAPRLQIWCVAALEVLSRFVRPSQLIAVCYVSDEPELDTPTRIKSRDMEARHDSASMVRRDLGIQMVSELHGKVTEAI
jgi:hypothetical protein